LAWLDPDSERSGEEYLRLRFRLTTYFGARNCKFPEDLADETIDRIALKIGDSEVQSKMAFAYGFAKNVFRESLRKEKDHQNIEDVVVAAKETEEVKEFSDTCLDECLEALSAENRRLILDYYSEEKQAKIDLHKQIAQSLKMTQTALRMRILRLKKQLRACVEECLV
jgi:DNA-directed RNA polymerase specialized sigma24 family protein